MLIKLHNIFGQGLLAFLPALLVAFISHSDIKLSANFSLSFAVVGVFFSIFYMGQRAYIAVNGVKENSFINELAFRDVNLLIACVFTFIFSMYYDLPLWLVLCAISVKLSESPLELNNGIELKYKGSYQAAKNLFRASAVRAICIVIPLFVIDPLNSYSFQLYSLYYLVFALIVMLIFKSKVKDYNKSAYQSIFSYLANFSRLKVFAFSTIICSVLSALPRLLTSSSGDHSIILIALSLSPALAVVFQAIWLANIEKLNSKTFTFLIVFYLEIFCVLLVVYFTSPFWSLLIPIIYGVSATVDIETFVKVILIMSLFFSAMTLMNCFKFYRPELEFIAYISSTLTLLFSVYLEVGILDSLVFASSRVFLI